MGLKETLYELSPIWMQNYLISTYGQKLCRQRYGKVYHDELKRLKNRDFTNYEDQKNIQNATFLEFLSYAVENSPFYKEFYKGIDLSQIKTVDDITKLPILDKETLRENIEQVYTLPTNQGHKCITGGTTGKSLTVYFTSDDIQKRMAYLEWFKSLYGFDILKHTSARFNGKNIIPIGQKKKVYWRDNRCIRQRIYSSFFTSLENLPYYVHNLNEFKPQEMDGFVTSLYEVAKFMDDHGIKPTFKPMAIFPTSETVLQHHRDLLAKVFDCSVVDQYASSEGAPFIIQLPDGYMHECIDTGVFEHIKTDNGTKLVVTAFHTHGTPLIRYDIGDNIVEFEPAEMPENKYGFPIIKAIDGRKADSLYSKERGHISIANLSNVVKNLPNSIKNIQFIQESIDHIHIKLVVDSSRYQQKKQEPHIIEEMYNRFGKNMTFSIQYVDEIKRTRGGKYRMIINKLNK
ncbi:MAG: phenylacetate--CoA ligase family protein [Aeriscardovia sp.]|nr:phenylacetate--CoA ligase family protein [Aeriscardovia sp.]MBO6251888.1 phenylacetate--CoA ligase family protein [Muribaculaceae bacterium]